MAYLFIAVVTPKFNSCRGKPMQMPTEIDHANAIYITIVFISRIHSNRGSILIHNRILLDTAFHKHFLRASAKH